MKTKLHLKILSFILLFLIVLNTFYGSISYASETELPDGYEYVEMIRDNEKWSKIRERFWQYMMSQGGALLNGDMMQMIENDETLYNEYKKTWGDPKWRTDNITIVQGTGSSTGVSMIKISKAASQSLLDLAKTVNKQPENGGYELVKTVPLSQISTMYFDSVAEYKTLLNLLNDNDGYVGFYRYGDYKSSYFKVNMDEFWIKSTSTFTLSVDGKTKKFDSFRSTKNANSGYTGYTFYSLKDRNTPIKNWNDTDNIWFFLNTSAYSFYGMDLFDTLVSSSEESVSTKPFSRGVPYIISKSGASIPVFNTLNDAIRYMVDHNLYYTGSNYTGEGKEIVIPFDEIDKILNGYYDDMYDMLQRLIEQSGSNALTPEQLQKLVDEVQTTFGMLKQTINEGFEQQDILIQKNSQILQNTADALNAFFSQTKEFRSTFLKSFNDYTKGEKERDEMLYTLLSDYIESQKNGTGDGDSPGDGDSSGSGETGETEGLWEKITSKLDDIFYSSRGENFLELIHEDISILTEQFEDFTSDFTKYMRDIIAAIKNIKIRSPINVPSGGTPDVIDDFLDFLTDGGDSLFDKAEDKAGDLISGLLDVFGTVVDVLTEKFPFSIPWDVLAIITALAAEPEAPHFEIPIILEHYGINEKIIIDLSDYEAVSNISRTMLTVIWTMYLMNFTTRFTDTKHK